jgi:chromosome partitioning protein
MTITVANGKGGAGKTTLCALLALAFQESGHSPVLEDCDPQKTLSRWAENVPGTPGLVLGSSAPPGSPLLIDTPPRLVSVELHNALARADVALLVTSPSPADLWTSQDTVRVILEHLPRRKPARIVFNNVQKNTILAGQLEEMAGKIGLPRLQNVLTRRQCYQHASVMGWAALDAAAREEVLRLALEISTLNNLKLPSNQKGK